MPLMQVIVLAVVQGFTEFLPVSSTAHLYLSSWLLHWEAESLDFDLTLHLGTLVAVLLYFGRDWLRIVLHDYAEGPWRNPYVMGCMLIGIGVVMWIAEGVARKARDIGSVTLTDSI